MSVVLSEEQLNASISKIERILYELRIELKAASHDQFVRHLSMSADMIVKRFSSLYHTAGIAQKIHKLERKNTDLFRNKLYASAVEGIEILLDTIREINPKRIIFFSSGDPFKPKHFICRESYLAYLTDESAIDTV